MMMTMRLKRVEERRGGRAEVITGGRTEDRTSTIEERRGTGVEKVGRSYNSQFCGTEINKLRLFSLF